MARMELGTIESIQATRSEDEYGWVELRITTEDGESVKFTLGRFYDDAATLAELLTSAAKDADGIVRDWRDLPDADADGFVFDSGRDGYLVQLEGLHWNGSKLVSITQFPSRDWRSFPTRDIAEYELAAAMAHAGCFPNVWYEDERGWSEDIDKTIRKFHDEGGDKLLPLDGVEYEDGADVIVDGWGAYVVRDYGKLGIVYVLSGDDQERFTDDRSEVSARPDDDEDD